VNCSVCGRESGKSKTCYECYEECVRDDIKRYRERHIPDPPRFLPEPQKRLLKLYGCTLKTLAKG